MPFSKKHPPAQKHKNRINQFFRFELFDMIIVFKPMCKQTRILGIGICRSTRVLNFTKPEQYTRRLGHHYTSSPSGGQAFNTVEPVGVADFCSAYPSPWPKINTSEMISHRLRQSIIRAKSRSRKSMSNDGSNRPVNESTSYC